jgi:hypothetical protein
MEYIMVWVDAADEGIKGRRLTGIKYRGEILSKQAKMKSKN